MEKIVVFLLGQEYYALPITAVREIIKKSDINPLPNSLSFIKGVINLRGKVVPVMSLALRFELETSQDNSQGYIMILDCNGVLFGILVDMVTEVMTITRDRVQKVPETIAKKISETFLQGVIVDEKAKHSDQRLILMIRAETLFSDISIIADSTTMISSQPVLNQNS